MPGVVGRQHRSRGRRVVEEDGDVRPGQGRGHQPEGRQGRVPAADTRIGEEHPPVPGGRRELGETRARVGDGHHPGRGVDPGRIESGGERTPLAVGLDRRTGLAGHDHDGAVEPVGDRGADPAGIGGVEDRQLDPGGPGDDLRGERGPAHAAEHDPVQTLRPQVGLQRLDLGEQWT